MDFCCQHLSIKSCCRVAVKTHRRQIIAVNAVTFVKMSYQHHNQIGTISPENTRDPCFITCQTTRNQSGVGSRSQLYQIYNNIINPHELVRPTHSRDIECWIISLSALLVIPVCESSQPHYSLCSTFLSIVVSFIFRLSPITNRRVVKKHVALLAIVELL